MKPGKIIAALVLIGAVAVIAALRMGGPADEPASASSEGGAAGGNVLAQAVPDPAAGLPEPGSTRVYTVDASRSEIYWRIYRAGAAARFGHNHVISVGELDGSVTLASELADTEWTLSFPVAGLVIDDAAIRARHGEDFESEPSEEDKAGTKSNMLTEDVLDGEMFPRIRLTGTGVEGSLEDAMLEVSIEMLGRTIEQTFPAAITLNEDALTVTGEHRISHTELGMEPFTALGGLMAVGEDIDFTYTLHAIADD